MKLKFLISIAIVFVIAVSLFYDDFGILNLNEPMNWTILLEIRVPRVIIGILVGVILSITGYVFQTIFNNNLADSFSLGLASGASFGSALAIVLGLSLYMTSVLSVLFSLFTLLIVLVASRMYHHNQTMRLLLIGMFINLFFSSCVYILVLAFPKQSSNIMNYLFGSINTINVTDIMIIFPITIVGVAVIYYFHQQIEILALGHDRAISLGLKTDTLIYGLLIITSIMCAVLISMTGIIGFVGMIIPPFVRMNFKGRPLTKLNLILLISVLFVLIGDFIGREIIQPVQIPVSIMMCLLGMPLLMTVLIKQQSIN
ncbi:FecCD family ABC transporter permease [Macrococcoides caseolyticum]|uniref:FecCD family ABC transporter permease n=1 Tax=Macrococcoides caseolyticum TaxID=69966 RepID=UPI001F46BEFB|nr:iron ABC transporter permease [Macrococcus caseolyticus]MCE4957769.1 iron ABC transporter permease [Macrococcus caseolyticus]